MAKRGLKQPKKARCEACGNLRPEFDLVNVGTIEGGYRQICNRCHNEEVAIDGDLAGFEHVDFDPISLKDCGGKAHEFFFRTRLFGPGVALDALEVRDGQILGYQFHVIGEPECDLLALLGRLVERIRRGLSVKNIEQGECGLRIVDQTVRGRIEWDEGQDGQVPLIVVDGEDLTWEEFGRMLMTFEGWQFRLEIKDMSEEA